jgi:predicted Zn-dependent peptidase
VGFGHKDSYVLEVIQQLLNGRTGRLYKGLVLGKQVASDTSAGQESLKWSGAFGIGAEVKDGHTLDEVEQAIYAEVDRLRTEDVPEQELQKVKNNFAAAEYRKLSSNFPVLMQLIANDGFGDWHEVNTAGPRIQAVTAADIRRVVAKYFVKENRAVAIYTRKPGTGAEHEDEDLAGLDAERKQAANQFLSSLKQQKDSAKLKAALLRMEKQPPEGEPKDQQLQMFIRKKVAERVAELEKK